MSVTRGAASTSSTATTSAPTAWLVVTATSSRVTIGADAIVYGLSAIAGRAGFAVAESYGSVSAMALPLLMLQEPCSKAGDT